MFRLCKVDVETLNLKISHQYKKISMETIYESKYSQHQFDAEKNTLYSNWFTSTGDMTSEEFKSEMKAWLKATETTKPEKIYDYCVNFVYPIIPEEQVWMAHLLNPNWIEYGVKKYAHIVPIEFIINLSVEQMFEEFFLMNLPNQFEIKHFSVEAEAQEWLFNH
jgi:hypothetical protein